MPLEGQNDSSLPPLNNKDVDTEEMQLMMRSERLGGKLNLVNMSLINPTQVCHMPFRGRF